jgi:hypothetical protein
MKEEKSEEKKKICFIITPIGSTGSTTRKRVDQWEELIYKPALSEEFNIVRADSAPGLITSQILDHIITADLAIIDYTELNPNVMYEAAIRHLANKPFIQIAPDGLILPFDIQNLRTIKYDPNDLTYTTGLLKKIRQAYIATTQKKYKVPEVLPIKFDLEKIVSDPEKFVELLKKHLTPSKEGNLLEYQENISEIYESPMAKSIAAVLGSNETVTCPKCRTIQTFTRSPLYSNLSWATGNVRHYKCNVCETEFV